MRLSDKLKCCNAVVVESYDMMIQNVSQASRYGCAITNQNINLIFSPKTYVVGNRRIERLLLKQNS